MGKTNPNAVARTKRKLRIRNKIEGAPGRPRVSIFRSNKHIYAQIIDDTQGCTLAGASSLSPEIRAKAAEQKKRDQAGEVGKLLAQRAKEAGVSKVVFDRSGYAYHGRIKALADGAREGGLEF